MSEIGHALRSLTRNPALCVTAIGTLAIGIGVNTAVFTVANAVLLQSLPYTRPDRLIIAMGGSTDDSAVLSKPFFDVLAARTRTLSAVAICVFENFNLTRRGDPEQIPAARASADFFDVLGVRPVAGRGFLPEEDRPGGRPVVLLSHEYATRLFGRPDSAPGKSLTLDSSDYTVVGVLPKGFSFSLFGPRREIWTTRVADFSLVTPARVARGGTYFNVIGRLRDGVSREQATAELAALYQQYAQEKPGNFDSTLNLNVHAVFLQDQLVAGIRPTLLILWAAVGLVLLIACANVANLLLSRAIGRRKEFAVRVALGATRWTLIRYLLIESLVIATVSGALGVALAALGTRILVDLNPDSLRAAELSISASVLAYTVVLSLLSGILFGLAPAIQVTRTAPVTALRDESRGFAGGRRGNRSRNTLVIVQVALSMVLIIASGLLLRSYIAVRNQSQGFDTSRTLTMQITLPKTRYSRPEDMLSFYRRTLNQVKGIPGVEASTLSTALPPTPNHLIPVLFEGQPAVALGKRPLANLIQVSPDYLKVTRIPLLAGRLFSEHDDTEAPQVAVVNQLVARRFWPDRSAVGKRLWIGGLPRPYEIVGVLGDTRNNGSTSPPQIEVLLPFPQMPVTFLTLSLRTSGNPYGVATPVRRALASIDPDQPVTELKTMEELVETLDASRRFMLLLITTLSVSAFVLALVGIYGVISYGVAQRTQELGIRMALGASRARILKLVIVRGLLLTVLGTGLGAAGSLALTQVMSKLLYQISARDPFAYLASVGMFLVLALFASYLPAYRATRIDPAEALRTE